MNIAVAETRILDNEVFNNPEHKHTFKKNMFFNFKNCAPRHTILKTSFLDFGRHTILKILDFKNVHHRCLRTNFRTDKALT